MFLTFESSDIILWCDYSNENFLAVRSHGTYLFYSAFYKTKLLSRISTLVNFASERGKTLFSGGTRGRGLGDPPPYFQINQRAPGKRTFFTEQAFYPSASYLKVRMTWAPYYRIFGFVFSGSRSYIII